MTVETNITPELTTTGNSWAFMAYIEYAFYLLLLAGVLFIAYQVMNNRWQLIVRPEDTPSTAAS